MKPLAIASTLAALVATTLGAQTEATPEAAAEVLTLERAIDIALDSNRELKAADARVGAAEAGVGEARAARLPHAELAGIYQTTNNPVYVFSNLLGQSNFRAENFALDALNEPDSLSNWKSQLTLSQPLWTGGRIKYGLQAANRGHDAELSAREATRQQVVHRVIESYTGAVLARRELEVAREALETVRAHVKLTRDLEEGGLVCESDRLQAEVRESEVRELVIRAESGVEISAAALNLAMGRDLALPVSLPDAIELETAPEPDLAELVAQAGGNRPDLRSAKERGKAAQSMLSLARADRWPKVGLNAGYEANAEDFFGTDGDNYSVMVGLRFNLFDGFATRARVERAREQAREADEMQELLAQSIALEVRRSFYELRAAAQRLEQARRSVELAARSHDIIQDRYREGLTILPELLDGETALTRARLREVAARRDVLVARATLDLATGNL